MGQVILFSTCPLGQVEQKTSVKLWTVTKSYSLLFSSSQNFFCYTSPSNFCSPLLKHAIIQALETGICISLMKALLAPLEWNNNEIINRRVFHLKKNLAFGLLPNLKSLRSECPLSPSLSLAFWMSFWW